RSVGVRELAANAGEAARGAAGGWDWMTPVADGRCHCDPRGGSVLPRGPHNLKRDELGLRPHAESDWLQAVTAENREGRPPVREDSRTWQRRVNVIKNDVLQEKIRAGHPGRDLVVGVDDVVTGPPVLPSLPIR